MGKERIAKWDNIKFVLITFVAIGHMISTYLSSSEVIKSLYFFIYTFHMPAFILISGMMLQGTVKNKRYEKLFPYLTMGIIIKLSLTLVKWFVLERHEVSLFEVNDVSWYAFAVFVFALATVFLQRFRPAYIFILSVIVALAVGYDNSIGTYLTLSRIFVFYPFFLVGFYVDRQKLLTFSEKPLPKAFAGVIVAAVALISFLKLDLVYRFLPLLKGKESYASLHSLRDWGLLVRLAAYGVTFLISFAVIVLIPNVKSPLTAVGARTLSVYTLHFLLIYIVRDGLNMNKLLMKLSPSGYMYLAIAVAIIIVFVTALKPVNTAVSRLINPGIVQTEAKE